MPAHGSLTKEKGFPGGPALKNLPASQYRGHRVDPWVRKIPWRRDGNPLQCSCLEHSTDRAAWWATVRGLSKSGTRLSDSAGIAKRGGEGREGDI